MTEQLPLTIKPSQIYGLPIKASLSVAALIYAAVLAVIIIFFPHLAWVLIVGGLIGIIRAIVQYRKVRGNRLTVTTDALEYTTRKGTRRYAFNDLEIFGYTNNLTHGTSIVEGLVIQAKGETTREELTSFHWAEEDMKRALNAVPAQYHWKPETETPVATPQA